MAAQVPAALAYALQIYFDFSGYTDMALGLALLFGIVLPLAILVTLVAVKLIPRGGGAARESVDMLSVPLSVLGFGGIVWGLSSFGEGAEPPIR